MASGESNATRRLPLAIFIVRGAAKACGLFGKVRPGLSNVKPEDALTFDVSSLTSIGWFVG